MLLQGSECCDVMAGVGGICCWDSHDIEQPVPEGAVTIIAGHHNSTATDLVAGKPLQSLKFAIVQG